jgi:hypothetical protein
MTYFLASGRGNHPQCLKLARLLGLELCTYPWFENYGKRGETDKARRNLEGIRRAAVVLALLPLGVGSGWELGYADALGKPILFLAPEEAMLAHSVYTGGEGETSARGHALVCAPWTAVGVARGICSWAEQRGIVR